jgi:ComF family protein
MISLRAFADGVLSALFAPPCAVCRQILEQPSRGAVCERCWHAIVPGPPVIRDSALIRRAAAIGEYEGTLREIIHVLKYHGRRSAAPRLAALMAEHGLAVLDGLDALVPVPLHPRRERERGFNQAEELARGLRRPLAPVLQRVRLTAPQVELPAAERVRNVRNAFGLRRRVGGGVPAPLTGQVLVLVDDVTTTGATLDACARVLLEAGAAEVRALTAARVASARPK